jgi:hypothetical protein
VGIHKVNLNDYLIDSLFARHPHIWENDIRKIHPVYWTDASHRSTNNKGATSWKKKQEG